MATGDEIKQDRSADRAELGDLVEAFLRQGGQVTHLDWAGKVVDGPVPAPKPARSYGRNYADAPAPAPAPAAIPAETPVIAEPAPVQVAISLPQVPAVVCVATELRSIRREAARLLANLNAAALRAA